MSENTKTERFIAEIESVLQAYSSARPRSRYDDLSDLGQQFALNLITRAKAVIERASGTTSAYSRQLEEALQRKTHHDFDKLQMAIGILEALREDIESGYLSSLPELIHAELFSDFLEMAQHLLEEGLKDASAVIAGGTLEAHLRQLSAKNGVTTTHVKGRSKKAEQLNSDLAGAAAISKLDQKNITAWLDLRNMAAHARYSEYSQEQVSLLLSGIRDFMTRNPA